MKGKVGEGRKHDEVRLLRRKERQDRQETEQEELRKFAGKGGRNNKKRGKVLKKINVRFVRGERKRKRSGKKSEREQ